MRYSTKLFPNIPESHAWCDLLHQFSEALHDEPPPKDFLKGIRQQHNRVFTPKSTEIWVSLSKKTIWEFHPLFLGISWYFMTISVYVAHFLGHRWSEMGSYLILSRIICTVAGGYLEEWGCAVLLLTQHGDCNCLTRTRGQTTFDPYIPIILYPIIRIKRGCELRNDFWPVRNGSPW